MIGRASKVPAAGSATRMLFTLLAVWLASSVTGAASGAESARDESPLPLRTGIFLVASPEMRDPNFLHTVVLLVHHGRGGSVGVIVNRPAPIPLVQLLPQLEGREEGQGRVYLGGPVAPNGMALLIRSRQPLQASSELFDGIYFSGGAEALQEALDLPASAEAEFRAYLGYAGWAPGQLADEIRQGSWRPLPANADDVFSESPEALWLRLLRRTEGKWTRLGGLMSAG